MTLVLYDYQLSIEILAVQLTIQAKQEKNPFPDVLVKIALF